jgi:NAD binding domain of 6-phosphogluconate dehydrogenase
MDLGFLGLGQMGAAIAERLEAADVRLHVFDPDPVAVAPFVLRGAVDEPSAAAVAATAPIVFACLPHGAVSEHVAAEVAGSPALRIYGENRNPWNAWDTRPGVWIAAKWPELISRYSAPRICLAIGSIAAGGRSLSCVQEITNVGHAMRGNSPVTVESASMRLIAAKLSGSLANQRARNLRNSSALCRTSGG